MTYLRFTRTAAFALAAGSLLVVSGCNRTDPAPPPTPKVAAPGSGTTSAGGAMAAAGGAAAPAGSGSAAASAGEPLQTGPKGTEHPVPDSSTISKPAPDEHAKDSAANAPGDLTDKEERTQMPMAGQGHNYSGDARKAGQTEAGEEKPAR